MQKYELLFILPGTLDENEAVKASAQIVDLVKGYGEEAELQTMGKNRLAYPVKQIRYGYYYTITFNSTPAQVKELQAKLTITRAVLRHLVTHFNTSLTAAQKIAYTTNAAGVTMMMERNFVPVSAKASADKPAFAKASADKPAFAKASADKPIASGGLAVPASEQLAAAPVRPSEKLDIDQINKRLDDIIGGDMIAGV